MIADLKKKKMENANPQKQEFGSPSLQPSLRILRQNQIF